MFCPIPFHNKKIIDLQLSNSARAWAYLYKVTQNDNSDPVLCGVYRVLQFPPEGWLRMSIGHCGITWLTVKPNGRVSLRSMGDTGHLPPEQLST